MAKRRARGGLNTTTGVSESREALQQPINVVSGTNASPVHRIYAGRVVRFEDYDQTDNPRYTVEIFAGHNLTSTGDRRKGCMAPGGASGATFNPGDWVTIRIADGETPVIVSSGGSGGTWQYVWAEDAN